MSSISMIFVLCLCVFNSSLEKCVGGIEIGKDF